MAKIYTEKQKKLVNLILANLGNKENTMTMTAMLKQVGYADTTAGEQTMTLRTVRDKLSPAIKRMEAFRDKVLGEMESRDLSPEQLNTLRMTLDTMNRNIEILSGRGEGQGIHITLNDANFYSIARRATSISEGGSEATTD